ncbi:MAG: glycosyltransferase [Proteobacteria bacterium]|nr:glycosyltransferase [Pseudomonadota bacterium]
MEEITHKMCPIKVGNLSGQPLVSVIVSNYNYCKYIEQAIRSVFDQTYCNLEVIVCDDGSTDRSVEVLNGLVNIDARLKIIIQKNQGQSKSINTGFSVSKGEIICLLDADDLFLPSKVQEVVDVFVQDEENGACSHFLKVIDSDGRITGETIPSQLDEGFVGNKILKKGGNGYFAPTSGLSYRREVFECITPLPDNLRISADAYITQAAAFITKIVCINNCLGCYRIHGRNNYQGTININNLRYLVEELVPSTFIACRNFLSAFSGDEVAAHLKLDQSTYYLENIVIYCCLSGAKVDEVSPFSEKHVFSSLPYTARSKMLYLLYKSPRLISSTIARALLSNNFIRTVLGPLGKVLGFKKT